MITTISLGNKIIQKQLCHSVLSTSRPSGLLIRDSVCVLTAVKIADERSTSTVMYFYCTA